MSEEKIRLTLETAGTENVRQASKAVQDMTAAVDSLDDSIKSGVIKSSGELFLNLKDGQRISADSAEGMQKLALATKQFMVTNADGTKTLQYAVQALDEAYRTQKRYEEQVWRSSRSVDDLQESHVELYRAMQTRVAPAMDAHVLAFRKYREATEQSEKSTQAFGRRMLEASYMADDLQYGFRGIVNNIPRFADSFGLSATMVGSFGIAAVGVNQALQALGPLITDTESPLKKYQETLAELTDSTKAQEEAIKRQREALEKLGKTTTQRVEDILKLKSATEDLKDAEARLAEDRKNQKAEEDAANNRPAAEVDALGQRKEVVKSVISDAGNEQAMLNAIGSGLDAATPGAGITEADKRMAMSQVASEAGSNLKNLTPSELQKRANVKLAELKRKKDLDRQNSIAESRRSIFGGITAPKTLEEFNSSLERLGQYAPEFAGQINDVIGADAADAQFQQGLSSRSAAIKRRNEREAKASLEMASNPKIPDAILAQRQRDIAQFAAGEKSAAKMLPNADMFLQNENQRILQDRAAKEAAEKARVEAMSGVLGQLPDLDAMAARRRYAAGTGVGAKQRMAALEKEDFLFLNQAFMQGGMSEQDARRSATDTMTQSNADFAEFAKANRLNTRDLKEGFQASIALFQQNQQEMEEIRQYVMMLQSMANQQNSSRPNIRPQMNRARR